MPEFVTYARITAAGAAAGGMLLTAGMGIAHGQPDDASTSADGLVTVLVGGEIAVDSASPEAAAATVTGVCGGDPAEVTALARTVDADGTQQTVCAGTPRGDVLIVQNAAREATSAPAPPAEEAPSVSGQGESEEGEAPAVPGEGEAGESFNTEG
ncbi:hypothetical protein CRI77_17080 [Mycolicibacterium duvalii]|uniref:Uncharacterized protein n=1 Tax=Mycolicibacterium duvalii TaxID=39688 RepID=A0A7I7K4Q7_9MYCO|nr:hypothetical protein [Mycolicibacterium duvalii]MCV7367969.1 hypothetical protein [Mycolicibacterium duvalii]PEG39031.1 hypothetical protein CRI77_17080 [Mycolicibacterium duvalii]BBX18439.1 hypothetical protein MDUV_32990 [Mycolicibacterium duvalii]